MSWKALPIYAALLLAAFMLFGCGSTPEPQSAAAVAKAYRQWDESSIAGNAKVACSRMTAAFLKFEIADAGVEPSTCQALIKDTVEFVRQHPETKKFKISGITVNGDRATLTDRTPYGNEVDIAKMSLVRVNGRWRVDSQIVLNQGQPKRPPASALTS